LKKIASKKLLIVLLTFVGAGLLFTFSTHRSHVDFNTEVKPIFNKKCITCHGGVKRKAGFSLLFRSDALAKNKSGKPAIIPYEPEKSELIRRITTNDPEDRMPYKHEPLSEGEIAILRRWIKEGAEWGNHWAYVPVQPVEVPKPGKSFFGLLSGSSSDWAKNDIDYFIGKNLGEEELKPSPIASKPVLLRRVSLDLIGMPASASIAEKFLNDNSPNAYESLVDSLLASKHFGERWASTWLDLARYADTKGYERDDSRNIWLYRDWLIKSFNEDKPYDKFLTEQIAGDLLPNATDDQLIATAFHRNTMTNDEGGTDNEEFRTAAIIDRVNTTWQALMGTTFGCVQCHSHPYDPFTHDEYYQFMAFFNDTRDEDTFEDYPVLRGFDSTQKKELSELKEWLYKQDSHEAPNWIRFVKTWEPSIHSLTSDKFVQSELADTKWLALRNNGTARLKAVDLNDKKQLFFRYNSWKNGGVITFRLDKPDGPVLHQRNLSKTKSWKIVNVPLSQASGVHDLYICYSNKRLSNPEETGVMFDWFHLAKDFPGQNQPGYASARQLFDKLLSADVPQTPIMMENPSDMHRASFVFERGNWLVKGKEVQPAVPKSLQPLPPNAPHNRLGLAMWIADKKNPLTARTMVNRVWEQLFGEGLVETLEDMGTQGATPTNKDLLDHLSWKFMNDYNWSVKKLLREIVLSATYCQDSKVNDQLAAKDPFNKWLARGSRVRLSAEQIRDQGLFICGLLSDKMYGPSVMPYQPDGIWLSPYNGLEWKKSQGDDQYRRAVYTFWKRTAAYPSMITFDGASREVCTARRIRTNTPLQALVTLNDEAYLEMARHFAYRMQKEGGKDLAEQIKTGYRIALNKEIQPAALQTFEKLYQTALAGYKNDPDRTCEMVGVMDEHNNPETAALVVVANAMLNLDELVMKN
jgi:hypothetical protein